MPRATSEESSYTAEQDYESILLPAGLADLDQEAARAYLSRREAGLGRTGQELYSLGAGEAELEQRLATLGLGAYQGGVWRSTVAAMLLFGRYPDVFVPQAQIKLARFRGVDVSGLIIDRAELSGGAGVLIEGAAQFISRNMRVGGPIGGIYRYDTPEYPIRAVREAIANAVAHRDYRLTGQKVMLRMFDDRLEIESPGGLAGPVTLDTLELRRYSRNPRLAQSMYVLGLIEEMGTGIRRIKNELAMLGSGSPRFAADRFAFISVLPAMQLGAPQPPAPQPIPEPVAYAPAPVAAAPQATPVAEPPPVDEATKRRRAAWLRSGVSPRQVTALEYAGENGRITNREFRDLHPEISDEAARLDLADLVERGALMKIGSNRGTYYVLRE